MYKINLFYAIYKIYKIYKIEKIYKLKNDFSGGEIRLYSSSKQFLFFKITDPMLQSNTAETCI